MRKTRTKNLANVLALVTSTSTVAGTNPVQSEELTFRIPYQRIVEMHSLKPHNYLKNKDYFMLRKGITFSPEELGSYIGSLPHQAISLIGGSNISAVDFYDFKGSGNASEQGWPDALIYRKADGTFSIALDSDSPHYNTILEKLKDKLERVNPDKLVKPRNTDWEIEKLGLVAQITSRKLFCDHIFNDKTPLTPYQVTTETKTSAPQNPAKKLDFDLELRALGTGKDKQNLTAIGGLGRLTLDGADITKEIPKVYVLGITIDREGRNLTLLDEGVDGTVESASLDEFILPNPERFNAEYLNHVTELLETIERNPKAVEDRGKILDGAKFNIRFTYQDPRTGENFEVRLTNPKKEN